MEIITTRKAQEKATFVIAVACLDEDGASVVPATLSWSLVDDDGTIINSREDVSLTPAASMDVVLTGDDLAILTAEASEEEVRRHVVLEGTYTSDLGSGLTITEQVTFILENLSKVS